MSAGLKTDWGYKQGIKSSPLMDKRGSKPTQDAQLLRQVQQAGQAQIQVQRGDQVDSTSHFDKR